MQGLALLAQSLGLAYASGVSLYATVAFVGIASRAGWIGPLPGALGVVANPWVLGIALVLLAVELLASLVPVVATTWEAVHAAIRPIAAGAVAVLATWGADARVVAAAALLGTALGVTTHVTKLGLRAAIDTSPEPVSNAVATVAETALVATLAYAVWQHPWIALGAAMAVLVLLVLLVRVLWRSIRRVTSTLVGR